MWSYGSKCFQHAKKVDTHMLSNYIKSKINIYKSSVTNDWTCLNYYELLNNFNQG